MSSIPEDVYVDIFTRIPMKSLLACRCVCKFWLQIISNPNFVKMHLVHAKRKINTSIMFTVWRRTTYTKTYDLISSSKKLCEFDDPVEKDHPFEPVYIWNNYKRLFCIWNPATKEYKIIPKSPEQQMERDIVMYGFDYDCKIDDYKVINIVKIDGRYIFGVYTLGTNSWKATQTVFDDVRVSLKRGVLINGVLHWLAIKWGKDSNKIISLDISNDKFKEMEPPEAVSENRKSLMNVGALEGFLCVLDHDVFTGQLEVWVMQDYGVPESWTKRYAITHGKFMVYNRYVKLIWQFDKGEILFSTDVKLALYDPKQKRSRGLIMKGIDCYAVVDYVESLVSVNSGTYVAGTKKTKERKIFL